jgi:L-lactate utilization protein LutC
MIRNAKDLSPDQKTAAGILLGRHILDHEAIRVRAFQPAALSEQRRRQIADELRTYFAEVDANRRQVSDDEAEEIINEALKTERPGYRPHQ